jgi:hypothetical protein
MKERKEEKKTVDVLKHHLLQTLRCCLLIRIQKDQSLFTLTADCSSDVTWSHSTCYTHFGMMRFVTVGVTGRLL